MNTNTIRPQFPPNLSVEELIVNAVEKLHKTGKISKTPNSFFAYRMALQKELTARNYYPNMCDLSIIAGNLWIQEPQYIKAEYQRLVHDAKILFEEYCHHAFLPYSINQEQQQNLYYFY
ncbi:12205_t:CDS:1 [Ambispora gerdemannii]|uniref:12205_t:CDS:1 n=1 Tax=Ambispora gerdemannii TaxID=144530 RepID=A0A9N9G945_9GLOM|nr:12205_t:CDS:1 [Ambispora gerdemannii]